jgi:hypothetical protein
VYVAAPAQRRNAHEHLSPMDQLKDVQLKDPNTQLMMVEGVHLHNAHLVQDLYNSAIASIGDLKGLSEGQFDLENVADFCKKIMESAEKLPTLSGKEKKSACIFVFTKIVQNLNMDEGVRQNTLLFIEKALPGIIDLIVLASSGKLHLNEKWEKIKKYAGIVGTCLKQNCSCCCCKQ